MRRREFITLLGGATAWPLTARAQQPGKTRRIGVLMSFALNDPEGLSRAAALENGLRKLGWIKGHNLRIEYRWAGNPEVLRTDAAELLGMAPDLILANSTPVMAALREQRCAVPIVFTQVTDPVGEGLVQNLAHPGGHFTGFTSFEFSIGTKWLETLKQVAPDVTRVALVFNPQTAPFADLFWRPIEAVARSFAVVPTQGSTLGECSLLLGHHHRSWICDRSWICGAGPFRCVGCSRHRALFLPSQLSPSLLVGRLAMFSAALSACQRWKGPRRGLSRVGVRCVTRTSKKNTSRSKLREWQVVLIRSRGQLLGWVKATGLEAAELTAAKEFNLNPFHRKRLLLRERL